MTDLYDRPEALALIDAAKETPEDDGPKTPGEKWYGKDGNNESGKKAGTEDEEGESD